MYFVSHSASATSPTSSTPMMDTFALMAKSYSPHPRTLVPSHPRTLAPSHPRTLAPSYPRTLVPSYPRTLVPSHLPTSAPGPPAARRGDAVDDGGEEETAHRVAGEKRRDANGEPDVQRDAQDEEVRAIE